jgi:ferredoxin
VSPVTPLRLTTAACDRCGACVPKCSPKALRIGPGYILVDWAKCTGCGRCAEACETGAIALRGSAAAIASPGGGRSNVVPIESARNRAPGKAAPKEPGRGSSPAAGALGIAATVWTLLDAVLAVALSLALVVAHSTSPERAAPGCCTPSGWTSRPRRATC